MCTMFSQKRFVSSYKDCIKIRAQLVESQEAKMARFLSETLKILLNFMNINLYLHLCIMPPKLNSKLRGMAKKTYPTTSSNWKGKERREGKLLKRDKSPKKGSTPFKGNRKECLRKRHIASQFPSKRIMILRDNGDIGSENS
ncbi:hypothetical protein CR513_54973, partial [Mucuna pruriens]